MPTSRYKLRIEQALNDLGEIVGGYDLLLKDNTV